MAAKRKFDFQSNAFRTVLGFTFRHWNNQKARTAYIAFLVLVFTMADVLIPYYTGQLIDAVSNGSPDQQSVWNAAVGALVALLMLGFVSVIGRQLTFQSIIVFTLKMMNDVSAQAFKRIQRFSSDWHANAFAGSTVRKITRGMHALDLLNDTLLVALLPATIMLIGSTVLLALFWPVMGLIVGVGSVIFLVLTVSLSVAYVAPAATLANAWDTKLGGALADAVSCNSVVKAFGAETREESRLDLVLGKWRSRTGRTWRRGTLNGSIQGLLLLALRAAMLITALVLWQQGAASAGDIAFVLTSFLILQGYLREIGMHIRNLQRSVNDMEELVGLYDQPLGVEDKPKAPAIAIGKGEIVFDRVGFRYGRHLNPLYSDFSLTIRAGEKVGLVGHSGSGKTTFVKLIQRLYDVTNGQIRIDGQDIGEVAQSSLRSQIAIVQQEPILFHRTLADNIAYSRPGATLAQVQEAAKLASAHDFIMALPKGYDTLVGERGVKLSGGERQRVAIARAFLADTRILILDEATSSLDSESEVLIQKAMERLMVGRTTLVIAHRLSTVRSLDRLLVFERGKIIEEGSHDSLINLQGGTYRRLFERQALELTKGFKMERA